MKPQTAGAVQGAVFAAVVLAAVVLIVRWLIAIGAGWYLLAVLVFGFALGWLHEEA